MKIRTDFVTNSSSSCFSVEVAIVEKNGKEYSITDIPNDYNCDEGGTAFFYPELATAMTKYSFIILKKLEDKYELREVDKEGRNGRNDRIESVKVGDVVRLVKVEEESDEEELDEEEFGYYYRAQDNCYIDVQNKEGSLGILPSDPTRILMDFMDNDKVEIIATVTDVKPLSQRSKNAKKALISIHIEVKELEEKSSILRFSNIADLCKFLTDSIDDDCGDDEDEYYDEEDKDEDKDVWGYRSPSKQKAVMDESKASFTKEVIEKVKTIDNISKIVVSRDYYAWGEFADLIADNDNELCALAKKVRSLSGKERETAKAEMLKYIHTPNKERYGGSFGWGFDDFRYLWNDIDAELESLVKRLGSNQGPGSVRGSEYCEIDMITGEYTKYAEFVLE